jgi:serine/threonine protein kinase
VTPTRDELELYVIGAYDGDVAALEAHVAADPAARAILAEEAAFELLLRDAGAAARFCPGCDDVVAGGARCDACGAAIEPGGYTVERVLVSNAHGRMYVAHDVDGKQVALKELAFVQSPGPDAVAAFEREAKFLRALEHPGIPRFCAAFEEGAGVHTRYYLAQELVTGQALDARLADHWYSEAEILDIARQVLTILVYLQSVSPMVIHRDIKPANLIVRDDKTIALVDFGAAYVQGTTVGSTTIGTFGYMPAEQMAGIVDATTDGYALGASLLHLLTRTEPWRLLQGAVLGPVNVSAPVRAFLHQLTAPQPRDRFPTAAAALEALGRIERGETVMEPAITSKQPRWFARRPLAAIALAAAVSAGAGAAVVTVVRDSQLPHDDGIAPGEPVLAGAGDPAMEAALVAKKKAMAAKLAAMEPTVPAGKPIDLQFKAIPLPDVVQVLGDACGLNVVYPDHIDGPVTLDLTQVPCDQALEVLLESRGLWYRYDPDAKLIRIGPRGELDAELEAAAMLGPIGEPDALPAGPNVDLDFKWAPLRELLTIITKPANVSMVLPDHIDGRVTVRLKDVPWDHAFTAILAAHGLGYRYRDNGRIVRIAPQKELHAERERELEMLPRKVPAP